MRDACRFVLVGVLMLVFSGASTRSAFAQMSLVGDWTGLYPMENQVHTIGDYSGLPINEAARAHAVAWDDSRWSLPEHQCRPRSSEWAFRGPGVVRIWEEKDPTTQDVVAIKTFLNTFAQTRTIWMDGRPHPSPNAPHTWTGFSTGTWDGNKLTVTTTHLKRYLHRLIGVPSSDKTTLTEQFIRHGNYLTHVMTAHDPVYLTEYLVESQNFILNPNVAPSAYQTHVTCQPDEEIASRTPDYVPHHLPGKEPDLDEFGMKYGIPFEANMGGAATMYPEYVERIRELLARPDAMSRPSSR
jgi:hypothetical protein